MIDHGLHFEIEGATFNVDEVSAWVADIIHWPSEAMMEAFAHDAAHAICRQVSRKVYVAKAQAEHQKVRRAWVKLHPPNHAGYYYCHIGGEWVHETMSQLEHIVPGSVERINMEAPGWDEKLRMACGPHNFLKGSSRVVSATLEIAPPDGEC